MAFGANFWCQFFALMRICSVKGSGGFRMPRCAFLSTALILFLPAGPCFAVDANRSRHRAQAIALGLLGRGLTLEPPLKRTGISTGTWHQ